jgi:hypothetical protein
MEDMMMTNIQAEQNLHYKLIILQAINYQKLGYTDIKINHENYIQGQPMKVGGYTPDLSAVFDDQTTLCEVATNDSINESLMIKRWKAFGTSGYEFHLIIPKNTLNLVKEIAKNNGINVAKYWYSKSC